MSKNIKCVFLDIDGCLNVIPEGHDEFGAVFHKRFMANLKEIIDETDAKIVITSTWRSNGLDFMQDLWKARGYAGDVIDVTPSIYIGNVLFWDENKDHTKHYNSIPRGFEIKYWLEYESSKHGEVTDFVILDDDGDMLLEQKDNFVMCSGDMNDSDCVDIGYGLTQSRTNRAIKILNK